MRKTIFWCVLCAAAGFLLRPLFDPQPARAQPSAARGFHVEPGTFSIPLAEGGSTLGKVVVDLNTGDVYGFPTQGKLPYPGYQLSEGAPLSSSPVYLGRYRFDQMRVPARKP
jgi:hypothetical protein